ncbi:MAG: hypothetical protein IJ038_05795 [Clostridia bacterium]|nr:hypothetical protein [Clostridia bacterium]
MKKLLKIFVCAMTVIMLFSAVSVSAADRHQLEAQYIGTAPTIDGVITEAEWGTPFIDASYTDTKFYYASTLYTAILPTNVKYYVRWDATNLYIGAQVTDATHSNPHVSKDIWYGDSLQIDICAKNDDQAARWRTNTGLSTADNKTYSWTYNKPNSAKTGLSNVNSARNGSAVVAREGTVTTYELTFPWSYYRSDATIKNDFSLLINFQLYLADGSLAADGTSFPGTTFLGSLTYGVKDGDSVLYPLVTLKGAPADFTSTTTAATTTAAKTTAATTKATTTAATTAAATTTATEAEADSGCGSVIGVGTLAVTALVCGTVVSKKRRK